MFSLFLQTTQFKNDGHLTPLQLFLLCSFLYEFSFDQERVLIQGNVYITHLIINNGIKVYHDKSTNSKEM